MKHNLKVTLILIILFLTAHLIGLFVIKHYLPTTQNLPLGIEKPQFNEKTSYIPIFLGIIIATVVALILMKFAAFRLWKAWYFLSIFLTTLISLGAFFPEIIALITAALLSILKVFKNNVIIHNLTELFVYGGLAAIFVPILNIFSIVVLLVLISLYDIIAVWKTKHMVSMAKFQVKSKLFAGLFVPYSTGKITNKKIKVNGKKQIVGEAILGGGDIAFPLLFSGVILKTFGFIPALITSITAAIALVILFIFAKKKKFYPAMPFISAGSLVGLLIVYLLF